MLTLLTAAVVVKNVKPVFMGDAIPAVTSAAALPSLILPDAPVSGEYIRHVGAALIGMLNKTGT
jgi:hypothetical protein